MMIYAGIGSRETPDSVLLQMENLARELASRGWMLSSGGALGADSAFEAGCDQTAGPKRICLPWREYNDRAGRGVVSLTDLSESVRDRALRIAAECHPAWQRCSAGARLLHGRNSLIVLGTDLLSPVKLILCWTRDGKDSGGTGQALRLAARRRIPVWNLYSGSDGILERILARFSEEG